LADALPRLFLMRDRLDQLTLLLPHEYRKLAFVEPSLLAFGVDRLRYLPATEVLRCRRLFMPTHVAPAGFFHAQILHAVRDLLLRAYGAAEGGRGSDRVYISRRDARRRRIANEEALLPLLERFGFQVIRAESCSFSEQVRLAHGARYLVSNHGAGLTNMLFMEPGTSVLELRHATDSEANCYFALAGQLGLRYLYQTCAPVVPDDHPHTADVTVDLRRLEENLEEMLAVSRLPSATSPPSAAGRS
jgi:capsular polysaccharide biosynthesis protein